MRIELKTICVLFPIFYFLVPIIVDVTCIFLISFCYSLTTYHSLHNGVTPHFGCKVFWNLSWLLCWSAHLCLKFVLVLQHCAGINCLALLKSAVSEGSDYLFTGSRDGTLKRWTLAEDAATCSATFESHVDWVILFWSH